MPEQVRDYLTTVSPRAQANYIFSVFVLDFAPYLTTELDAIGLDAQKAMYGASESPPRWKTCVSQLMMKGLRIAVGSMYVKAFLTPSDKKAVEDIVKDLMTEFKTMLTEEAWMDPKTRAVAEKKVDKMKITVGYPKGRGKNISIFNFQRGKITFSTRFPHCWS